MGGVRPSRIAAVCVSIGALLLCGLYIARSFQWGEALALLWSGNLGWFFLGGGSAIIGYWVVRAYRWRFLMRGMQADAEFVDLYLCSSVALSLAVFTPLQSGEALKVELLKRYGSVGRMPGYSAFVLERVADLYVVIAIGLVSLASYADSPFQTALLVGVLIAFPIAAYFLLHKMRLPGRMGQFLVHLQSGIGSPVTLFILLFLTLLGWMIVALGWQACLFSLSIALGFADLLVLFSVVTLASILSFVPGGLGVVEAGAAELLIRYDIAAPLAQAGALVLREFSLLVIVLGALHYLLMRARQKRRSDRTSR